MTHPNGSVFIDGGAEFDGKAQAHVVVLPGRGEPPGAYRRLARRLAVDSVRTIIYAGPYSNELPANADDIAILANQIIAGLGDTEGKPVILIGSDTGSLAALHVAHELPERVSALVIAGVPDGRLINEVGFNAELDIRSACTSYRGILQQDQGVRRGAILSQPIPAYLRQETRASELNIPVLVFQGDHDPLSDLEVTRKFIGSIPKVKLFVVKHGRHDVLNDHDHRAVGSQISFFIQRARRGAELPPILEDALDTIGA